MGKTTTARLFAEEGCPVFDADAAVHGLYAKGGEAVPLIRAVFPDAVRDGAIDRTALGKHMREDPLNLRVLESFIHPMVGARRAAFFKAAETDGADIVVLDVPLLFETGGDAHVDYVIVVTAPKSVQRARVLSRPGMSPELLDTLLSRQMTDAEKRRRADILIYTDKGVETARKHVQKILKDLRK